MFQHISFTNLIFTIKSGSQINYITWLCHTMPCLAHLQVSFIAYICFMSPFFCA